MTATIAAALDQAKADVAAAQADIENVKAALQQQQAVISQARATVAVDQANLTFAEEDNARYEALANRGSGSVQNAQQALSKRDTARATLERDTAAVVAAEQQVGVLQAQLAKANATLLHDQAVQEQAQLNLGYTNDRGSYRRCRRQPQPAGRRIRSGRHPAHGRGAARCRLCGCEFRGNPA